MKAALTHQEKNGTKLRRVDFFNNDDDFACVLLAALGQSNESIKRETGYTIGQISYRLRQAGSGKSAVRRDYRDGKSALASMVVAKVHTLATKEVTHLLEENVPHSGPKFSQQGGTHVPAHKS